MITAALAAAGCKPKTNAHADGATDALPAHRSPIPQAPHEVVRMGDGGVAGRIVSLVPSATEMMFALGAGDRVVGVSNFCDFPAEVTRLPRVGTMVAPSFEAIVALRPDGVVGVQGPINVEVLDRLVGMGVRGVFPRVESLEDVHASLDVFAELVGRQAEAAALHQRIRAEIARVEEAVRGRARPKVLGVFGQSPLVVAGPGSWFDEILRIAGGENVVVSRNHYPMFTIEQVLALQPDVVIDLALNEGNNTLAAAWASYGTIPAVAHRRVIHMNDPVMVRQGPRIGGAAQRLARALHPEVRW